MKDEVRVRYAPSPTGHLHIGNARTALFNYLFARHFDGKLIIRIEDTDQKRNVAGGEENQLHYLKWLGIDWDESIDRKGEYGPYRQMDRLEHYQQYAQELVDKGLAYPCYCTEEELQQEREAQLAKGENPRYSGRHRDLTSAEREKCEAEGRIPSIRFRVQEGREYVFQDMVKGEVRFASEDFGDFVILKKDGIPTYQFAVVVDDYLMKISHVLRGDDHITNTPKQLMIYEALGWEPPEFAHMTLIVNESRKKLSKRDETILQFLEQYDHLGYLPEALFNFISLLGWSPEGEEEILSKEELIDQFTPTRLSKSPAVFDAQKLSWMNNHYIKHADSKQIAELAIPHLQKAGKLPEQLDDASRAWAEALVELYQEQMNCGADIVSLTELFFQEKPAVEAEAANVLNQEHVSEVLTAFRQQINQINEDQWQAHDIKAAFKAVQKGMGYKGKQLFMPVRAALTGQTHGRDLNQTIILLGREVVLKRLATTTD